MADPTDRATDRKDDERRTGRQTQHACHRRKGEVDIGALAAERSRRFRHLAHEPEFRRIWLTLEQPVHQHSRARIALWIQRMAESVEALATLQARGESAAQIRLAT